MTRRAWTDRDDRVMRVLHRSGHSSCAIADYLEFDRSTIKRKLREAGLRPKFERARFTADMDESIRINYPMWPAFLIAHLIGCSQTALFHRAHRLGVEKHPDHWRHPMAHLWNSTTHPNSIATRIKSGNVPPNKGLRRPGYAAGRMGETQFKKGRPAHHAHNYVPIGSEKVCAKRKNLVRKVTDDPQIVPVMRWRPVHVLVWELAHGPVTKGHICVFRPGMKTFVADEITVDKLEVITLVENMRRNTIHNLPEDLKGAIRMRGCLVRTINRLDK